MSFQVSSNSLLSSWMELELCLVLVPHFFLILSPIAVNQTRILLP